MTAKEIKFNSQKNMIYSTDTMHCKGKECKRKENCLRYKLHEIREGMKGAEWCLIPYVKDESYCIKENYVFFNKVEE